MSVKLLTEQHLKLLSLTGACTGSSESTLVKMPHCWKSHGVAQMSCDASPYKAYTIYEHLLYFCNIGSKQQVVETDTISKSEKNNMSDIIIKTDNEFVDPDNDYITCSCIVVKDRKNPSYNLRN